MQFLRTTLEQGIAISSNAPQKYDLPVNPLSVVFLTIQANNDVGLTTYTIIDALINALGHINVAYRGANIIDGDAIDLSVIYSTLSDLPPGERSSSPAGGFTRSLTVPICFGRTPYDPNECFPATRRGDLILTVTPNVPQTGLVTPQLIIETAELLDAKPKQFCKVTTIERSVLQTGDFDIELPISNDILGVMLRDPSPQNVSSELQVFGKTVTMMDNVTMYYNATNWDSIHAELRRRLCDWPLEPHIHSVNGALTLEQNFQDDLLGQYSYLDFDPLKDGSFALETQGAARVNLRVTATTTNEDTPAKALPVELVVIGGKEMAQPGA